MRKKRNRKAPEVNAGSMADIAFLLLIFFLVTTTIEVDKGILVKLPPYKPNQPVTPIPPKNIYRILVNHNNELAGRGESIDIEDISKELKDFILNPIKSKTNPSSPNKAVVSLQNDRGTSYDKYLEVYDAIKATYTDIWNETSMRRYGKQFDKCIDSERKTIKKEIPMVISEAEPTSYGKE